MLHRALDSFWNNLGNWKWTRFGIHNVRSLYRSGSLKTAASEIIEA